MRIGFCGLDRARLPLTGEEERACWEGAASEVVEEPAPVVAPRQVANGSGLWGIPALGDLAADRPAPSHGLWTETDAARAPVKAPVPASNSHAGSVRVRPWGQVPGGGKDAVYLRGLRGPRR